MKYFTNELWSKLNSDSQKERDEADSEWDRNYEVYSEIFQSVKITYKHIKQFNVNYKEAEGWGDRRGFDDWGYDEFLPIDEQTLSHEILFASGSTILICFKNGNVFVAKTKED